MNDRDAKWHDLYRVDLGSGERTLVERNTQELAGYVADADYKVRLATRARPDGGQDVLKPDGKRGWEVTEPNPFASFLTMQYIRFTIDGKNASRLDSHHRNPTPPPLCNHKSETK